MARFQFTLNDDVKGLLQRLPQIRALADSEKAALGFLPEVALRDAVIRRRLFAMTVDAQGTHELAGYILHSGVFPNAKVQQIAVHQKYRRSGVASALLKRLVSELERLGFMTVKAEVASDLKHASAFYLKNGFEIVATRPGGEARNRIIIVQIRQLDTDSLFSSIRNREDKVIDLGIRRRSAGDAPLFTFDLNIFFDLVRERAYSGYARKLFSSGLAHDIRLVVADEFVKELKATTHDIGEDPILQMALQLPRLPGADAKSLDELAAQIHDLVFVKPKIPAAGTRQALSDARHLAHAALARASAFVTRDGTILAARSALLSMIGIDVVELEELVLLLPQEPRATRSGRMQGIGFECCQLSAADLVSYLSEARGPDAVISEFGSEADGQFRREAVLENGRVVAAGAIRIPKGMKPIIRMLVHVRPEHVDSEMFADYLLDTLTRFACAKLATTIELIHVPGQSTTSSLAKARGFLRIGSNPNFLKVALGRPLTSTNWSGTVQEIRRRTELALPDKAPIASSASFEFTIQTGQGKSFNITRSNLEDILSPTIFIWPGRDGVIAPITRAYADDLLGTSRQSSFAFIANRDAAFLSRRSYVNSPRAANLMRPESPILFYESKRSGGRGAAVAVARIVDAVVIRKKDVPNDGLRRLVVDDVDEFSASDDVLLTTFDNLFVMPRPVPLNELRNIDAVGGANLVSTVGISAEKIATILTWGWSRE